MSRARTPPKIELLCVGTELLRGRLNTHQSHLSRRLQAEGLALNRESSLPDDVPTIALEVSATLRRADAVLLCGGLGPTFDDVTRQAVAAALRRKLLYKASLYAGIRRKFARHTARIPEENKRQAFVIQGAQVLPNPHGSAPGQILALPKGRLLALLPGPYSEMSPMFETHVLPRLKRLRAKRLRARSLSIHIAGLPESIIDERLAAISASNSDALELTILSSFGQVDYHATARAPSARQAGAAIAAVRRRVYDAVGEHIFGEGDETLESAVGARLKAGGLTLAVAESCTGGLLGQRLTLTPGSSDYFLGGVIAYSNALKTKLLRVPPKLLRRHGAVCAECALAMAKGARTSCGADIGVAITGIAGPAGATPGKPVGLVYAAIAAHARKPVVHELRLKGGREEIRSRAATAALHALLQFIVLSPP